MNKIFKKSIVVLTLMFSLFSTVSAYAGTEEEIIINITNTYEPDIPDKEVVLHPEEPEPTPPTPQTETNIPKKGSVSLWYNEEGMRQGESTTSSVTYRNRDGGIIEVSKNNELRRADGTPITGDPLEIVIWTSGALILTLGAVLVTNRKKSRN